MAPDLTDVPITVVTVSDRARSGERGDTTGPLLADAMAGRGARVTSVTVADGAANVGDALRAAIDGGARVVITTGGTGVGPRDETPEGTLPLIARDLPGLSERLRAMDADTVPTAVLSRGLAGVTEQGAIVVNVAGSVGAAKSAATLLTAVLPHALAQLAGADH